MTAPGPNWTRQRLLNALVACYGPGPRGGVDRAAVAEAFDVSTSTVTRWLAGDSDDHARIPNKRQLQLVLPPTQMLEDEVIDVANARRAIASLNPDDPTDLGRRPTVAGQSWKRQRWLEPHMVAVLELPTWGPLPLRQIVWSRGNPRVTTEWRRRGTAVDLVTVPTRFHAMVLVAEVLDRVGPWRLYPSVHMVPKTRTQVYAADAPALSLSAIAHETSLALKP